MRVRNLTAKSLGFGSVAISPDSVGTPPKDYDKDHPTVKYYLSRKWIELVEDADNIISTPSTVNVDIALNTGNVGENDVLEETIGDPEPHIKPVERMNKEELQAFASENGIDFDETDTKQMIIDKIKAAQLADK